MAIRADWEKFVASNPGSWFRTPEGLLSSPYPNAIVRVSKAIVLNVPNDGIMKVEPRGFSEYDPYDPIIVTDKDGVETYRVWSSLANSGQIFDVELLASLSPYTITYLNTSSIPTDYGGVTTRENRALIHAFPNSWYFDFDGDYTTLSQANFDGYILNDVLKLSEGATAVLSEGVGVTVSGGVGYHLAVVNFSAGETVAVFSGAELKYEYTFLTDVSIISNEFNLFSIDDVGEVTVIGGHGSPTLKLESGLTSLVDVSPSSRINDGGDIELYTVMTDLVSVNVPKFFTPNRTEAEVIEGLPAAPVHGSVSVNETLNVPFFNYDTIFNRDGEAHKIGYIAAKVTINSLPAPNRRVLCYYQVGDCLLGETRSDVNGDYRFDDLLLGKRYMLIAQDDDLDPTTEREYNAVAADFQLPTPYEA